MPRRKTYLNHKANSQTHNLAHPTPGQSLPEQESRVPAALAGSKPDVVLLDQAITVPDVTGIAEAIGNASTRHYLKADGLHHVLTQASVGLQHLNQKNAVLPCQDAVKAVITPRPILMACDGAGSASMSEIGSTALTVQLTRLCQSIEPWLVDYLDSIHPVVNLQPLVRVIIRHAIGVLQDLSDSHRRDMRDFRSTLNLVLMGTQQILWIKVGDGEIVQEKISYCSHQPEQLTSELSCIGAQNKGEFANQTQFIDNQLSFDDIQWGVLDRQSTTGLALMSDGASEKLVAAHRQQVSGQVSDWLDRLRHDKLKASDICKRFYSEEFNASSTGDDRSITLWAQGF